MRCKTLFNTMARPREHNREKIATDIIEWAKKEDSINVNKFCAYYEHPFPTQKLSEWSKEDSIFRESYDIAKAMLAARREELTGKGLLHVKCYDLSAASYDYIVKENQQQKAKYEHDLKSAEIQQNNEVLKMVSDHLKGSPSVSK